MSQNKRKLSLDNINFTKNKVSRKSERDSFALECLSLPASGSQDTQPKCGHCNETVNTSEIEISSLQCCLCNTYIHGCCLDIEDDVLSLLYVVRNLGGWCCDHCRRTYTNSAENPVDISQKRAKKLGNNSDTIAELTGRFNSLSNDLVIVKSQLQFIVDDLKSIPTRTIVGTSSIALTPSKDKNSSEVPTSGDLYSNVAKGSRKPVAPAGTSTNRNLHPLDPNTRDEVLAAMHSEISSINRRSTAVVISGLPSRSDIPDVDQFTNLCIQHLHISPTVKSTSRLGTRIDGKMQPLLVHLSSANDVTALMSVAKNLRTAKNDYIKTCVFLNRHLTKAAATAAWQSRVARRMRRSTPNSQAVSSDPLMAPLDATSTQTALATGSISSMNPSAAIFDPGHTSANASTLQEASGKNIDKPSTSGNGSSLTD